MSGHEGLQPNQEQQIIDPLGYYADTARKAEEFLSVLPEREKNVLLLRFGLTEDGRSRSVREVGLELGIPKSTAWDAEIRGLKLLRSTPATTEQVKDYLE